MRHSTSARRADPQLFDPQAKAYARRDEITGGWVADWLRGVLAGRSGASALDLGCGTGRVAALLAGRYRSVRAVDLSPETIRLARALHPEPRISFEQGDLRQVDGQYDLVVSVMALHHLPDPAAAIAHVASLAKPGGLVVVADAAQPPPRSRLSLLLWNLVALARDMRRAVATFLVNSRLGWLDHLVSDRWLLPEQFVELYGTILPGADIGPVGDGVYGALWQRPLSTATSPTDRSDAGSSLP